ncbi:MAG TPA: hypothetical protein VHM92_04230 [Allosphingosinicella sp.]|nr:hypothetical protein [Allosphingosinicella sp.]
MPVTEMIVGLSAGLFMLVGFVFFLRLIQAWLLHRTLRDAIKRDSAVAGTLVDRIGGGDLSVSKAAASNDDRTGMVLVALGIALVGFSLIAGEPEWLRYGVGSGLFPMLVGAALLLRHYLQSRSGEPDVAAGA